MAMELYLRSSNAQDAPDPPDANNEKPLIPLRLPAALLAALSEESSLVIDGPEVGSGEGEDGGEKETAPSLTVARGGAGNHPDCRYALEAADRKQKTEWYRSTTPADNLATKKELRHIGTTDRQYTVQPKSSTDLKEIGKRTRMVTQDERRKRKEIVRLDDNELVPRPAKRRRTAAARKPAPAEAGKMPPGRAGGGAGADARRRKGRVASRSNADGRTPGVDGLPSDAATDGEDRSGVVRLHGLPVGVGPEHVRKFFHGLSPSLVFALPSFPHRIRGWDAECDADGGAERHPGDFRVFVRFASAPVADAAIERSGETIGFDGGGAGRGRRALARATISLTPVPKRVASFLQRHMAIRLRKGERIVDQVTEVERKLGAATHAIWEMATRKLDLKRRIVETGDGGNARRRTCAIPERAVPAGGSGHAALARAYNRTIDAHEELEADAGPSFAHAFDPSCAEDSAHRIVQSVSDWLLDEIFVLGRLLKESRAVMALC